ncbi:hypothetical protein B0H11DRAFT_2132556 [Mycena galericulata]|nr:hypothetical protein B0H11DRAFT_2132556 [Mycena galericulata]
MVFPLPNLEYPITRTYPWPLFAPFAFGGAAVALVVLTVINVALEGYDTIPSFNSNFNVTDNHWYDRFIPSVALAKPGTLCDPLLLGLGDTVTTNNTLFQYTIASIDTANAGDSGVSYKGWTLDNCDITAIYVNGNVATFMVDFTAVVSCAADAVQVAQGTNYEITIRADWSESLLPGQYGQLLGVQKAQKNMRSGTFNKSADAPGSVLNSITTASSADFAVRVIDLGNLTSGAFPSIISFSAEFPWCPASLGRDAPCASQIPPLNITGIFEYVPNPGRVFQSNAGDAASPFSSDTHGIISNLVQVVYAAVRFDLGNPSPNNFLLNTSMIPHAVVSAFPQNASSMPSESYLYSVLVNDGYYQQNQDLSADAFAIPGLLPLTLPGPALLDGVYLCRFKRAKSPGTAFIAILVATISVFSAGWGRFLGLAESAVKKRHPEANECGDHTTNGAHTRVSLHDSRISLDDSREKDPFVD